MLDTELKGFIQLHRKFMNWEWYDDIPTKVLYLHCILRANFKEGKWHGIETKRGQFITSIKSLSNETGLSEQQTRTALKKLKSTHEITCQSTSRNTVITINNYDEYQSSNMQNNKQITCNQQTSNKQITCNQQQIKNDNNENNDNNIINENSQKQTNPIKKVDPYMAHPLVTYFREKHKEILGYSAFIGDTHIKKLIELGSMYPTLKTLIPIALKELKTMKWTLPDGTEKKPTVAWLLENENFAKVINTAAQKATERANYVYNPNL